MYNYFIEKPDLLDFVYNNSIFKLMSQLLDADHVLTSTSARNKRLIKVIDESKKQVELDGILMQDIFFKIKYQLNLVLVI